MEEASISHHGEDEPWLKEKLFYTRCIFFFVRECNVIINDGKSYTDMVSKEMVNKLKLETEPHPHQHKIKCSKRDSGLKVTKRCRVTFSIVKSYKDEVWCDVSPMDSCYVSLGRP